MAAAPPQKLTTTHDMFINWLLLNPGRSQRDMAAYFGYTEAWISTVINSDIFQAKLRARQDDVFSRVASSIPEKLRVAADVALDKLADKIADSEDPEFILSAADKVLHRMGYAPNSVKAAPGAPVTNNNVFLLSADDLEAARSVMRNGARVQAPGLVVEGEVLPPDQPAEG